MSRDFVAVLCRKTKRIVRKDLFVEDGMISDPQYVPIEYPIKPDSLSQLLVRTTADHLIYLFEQGVDTAPDKPRASGEIQASDPTIARMEQIKTGGLPFLSYWMTRPPEAPFKDPVITMDSIYLSVQRAFDTFPEEVEKCKARGTDTTVDPQASSTGKETVFSVRFPYMALAAHLQTLSSETYPWVIPVISYVTAKGESLVKPATSLPPEQLPE
ncbi:hypothetical protein M231_06305 [Tremella mesenterica]|uniref:Uncharacterized protein n=1 Tax=Tremella mesenterica TaxID=5217 RepID=A0A4Q1BGE6_TREME|nr:hypothetical protein M231_06305 [Tremella mesenterica]